MTRKSIDSLGPDPIQTNGKLEDIIVILGTGVDLADTFDHFTQRNATTEIANRNFPFRFVHIDLNFRPILHDELIDTIVDDLLQHDINSVIGMRSIPETTNIHP